MNTETPEKLITIQNEEDKNILFEQYKVITTSLDKINEIREAANTFWTGLNGALIAGIAYIRDTGGLEGHQKSYFIWTIIFLGIIFSSSWLSYLFTIKRSVDIRDEMLIEIEQYLPAKIFTVCINKMGRKTGHGSLSLKEMLVPSLFLLGYIFFAFICYFNPQIIVAS